MMKVSQIIQVAMIKIYYNHSESEISAKKLAWAIVEWTTRRYCLIVHKF
jgi:hypothetical protein